MAKQKQPRISRKKFVGLGLSAALLSSSVSPFVAKAQTVNFMAASSAKLSQYCRGDGTDETDQINKCLAENLFVEVDEPPAGVGYGFRAYGLGGGGLLLRSGHEILGQGANSKFLRVGKWDTGGKCFRNENHNNGDSSIKLNNLYIRGYRYRRDVPDIDSDSDSTGISIRANDPAKWCENIELTNVQVHDWPGVSIRVANGSNVTLTDVKSVNPSRGGIQFRTSKDMHLLRVLSADAGDDAIAFNVTNVATNSNNRPIYGITMDRCESYTRTDPQYGAALKFGGAREALVKNSIFRYSKNAQVTLMTFPGFNPRDIQVNDCKMLGGGQHSYSIRANEASLISARGNYMHRPAAYCVNVMTLDGRAATFDVTITGNTLSLPGTTRHINVQENLQGVNTEGNTLIYEYTTPPTLKLVDPKPGSSVTGPVKIIEALAKASVSKRDNDLRKSDVRLYINGVRVTTFDYYSSGTLIKQRPELRRGSNTIKVAFTLVGTTSSTSWT
jgi:hypothetical protein